MKNETVKTIQHEYIKVIYSSTFTMLCGPFFSVQKIIISESAKQ